MMLAMVLWKSTLHSTAVAHPVFRDVGHAVRSSGEAETFALSQAIDEFLHLSYIWEETGSEPMPKPLEMRCDATVAISFSKGTSGKSRMKHIDCRQAWVNQVRDVKLAKAVDVDTKDNWSDIFTKLMRGTPFVELRDQFMHWVPVAFGGGH